MYKTIVKSQLFREASACYEELKRGGTPRARAFVCYRVLRESEFIVLLIQSFHPYSSLRFDAGGLCELQVNGTTLLMMINI